MTRPLAILRRGLPWLVAIFLILLSGEIAARLDDWIFQDIPFGSNPDRERDLTIVDGLGIRGRPNGLFKKYKLNSHGVRGPEFDLAKPPGVVRVAVLGASETFGLYESIDHEYPALLRKELVKSLPEGTKVEIVNASVAGLALPNMIDTWKNWVHAFRPDIVVVYPSPQFYLDNEAPKRKDGITVAVSGASSAEFRSRLLERFKDTAKQSDLVRWVRTRYLLSRQLADKDAGWIFKDVPTDRVEKFATDLETLARTIADDGATPILLTHAFKTPSPPEPDDEKELAAFRIFFPRAEPAVMPAFDEAARRATIDLAKKNGWGVIDASAELSGHREWFADPVHFNDAGSQKMAEILARGLPPFIAPAKKGDR